MGIKTDQELAFCKKANNKLRVLTRILPKKLVMNSFFASKSN